MKAWALARLVWLEMTRRKDVYLWLLLFLAAIGFLLSTDAFGATGASRYLVDAGATLGWLASLALAISCAVRQLAQDRSSGAVYVWLSKPITRATYLLGKWLGVWTFAIATATLFYLGAWAAASLRGGTVDVRTLAQAWSLHAVALALISAAAMALATRLTASAAQTLAWVLVAASLILPGRVPELLARSPPALATLWMILYYAMPHLELLDLRLRLAHAWGPASLRAFSAAFAYGAVWTALALLLTWAGYRRRFFPRDDA